MSTIVFSSDEHVELRFLTVDIDKEGDELFVYDGNSTQFPHLRMAGPVDYNTANDKRTKQKKRRRRRKHEKFEADLKEVTKANMPLFSRSTEDLTVVFKTNKLRKRKGFQLEATTVKKGMKKFFACEIRSF